VLFKFLISRCGDLLALELSDLIAKLEYLLSMVLVNLFLLLLVVVHVNLLHLRFTVTRAASTARIPAARTGCWLLRHGNFLSLFLDRSFLLNRCCVPLLSLLIALVVSASFPLLRLVFM